MSTQFRPPSASPSASSPSLRGLLLCLLWLSLTLPGAHADITQGGGDGAQRPTLRVRPVEAQVKVGQSVDIPIEILGAGLRRVEFELIQAPTAGQLSAPQPRIIQGNPKPQHLLRFDARQINQPGKYPFRFRATALGANPSPAVDAIIEVLPGELRLFTPEKLDFGQVFHGQSQEQNLNLENGSLQPLRLTARLEGAGWRWKNQANQAQLNFDIPATAALDLPIEFFSSPEAQPRAQVTLSSVEGEKTVALFANPGPLLVIGADSLQIPEAADPAAEPTVAPIDQAIAAPSPQNKILENLTLSNESTQPLAVELLNSPQLKLPESLILEAKETRQLPINPDLTATSRGAQGILSIRYNSQTQELAWTIPAQPARARLLNEQGEPLNSLPEWPQLELGEQQRLKLRIVNVGGQSDFLHLSTEPPFFIQHEAETLQLAPEEAIEFDLHLEASILGQQQSQLRYGFGLQREELPLAITVVLPSQQDATNQTSPQAGDSPKKVDPDNPNAAEPNPATNNRNSRPSSTSSSTTRSSSRAASQSSPTQQSFSTNAQLASTNLRNIRSKEPSNYQINPIYDEINHNTLALSWPLPEDQDLSNWQWEISWLSSAVKEKGAWQVIPERVNIDAESNTASLVIKGITPGSVFYLRLTARDTQLQEIVADNAFQIIMDPRPSFWKRFRWLIWTTLGLGLVGGGFWWYRNR